MTAGAVLALAVSVVLGPAYAAAGIARALIAHRIGQRPPSVDELLDAHRLP